MLKLPIGIQSFETIRNEGYLYVDKTKYLIDLIDRGKVYFLSRPRRFGKSLTISTFDALFSGKKELFHGLFAEEFFERPNYKTFPVIRLDMSEIVTYLGMEDLQNSMLLQAMNAARRHGVELSALAQKNPSMALGELMLLVAEKEKKPAVVLVDEYDKPILDSLHDIEKTAVFRTVLQSFYTQIKAADERVRFVFITGISKFSKMGIFSAMNNLADISMDERYAAMLGYTEEELTANFGGYVEETAVKLEKTKSALIAEMRSYYDGFSFDGKTRLYNPFSTLNFFNVPSFRNYWFESGTPSFIARYIKDRKLTVEQFRGLEVSRDFASYPGEMENATEAGFLYQSGYLSLRPGITDDYSLDYPNYEVLSAMSALLTANILGGRAESDESRRIFRRHLIDGNAPGVVEEFNRLLAAIPYDDYIGAARRTARYFGVSAGEWLYRSALLSYLYGMGLDVSAEPHTSKGRADILVRFMGRVWLIELKVAPKDKNAAELADAALAQIREKGYADPFSDAVLLGLAIDDEQRAITEFRAEIKK